MNRFGTGVFSLWSSLSAEASAVGPVKPAKQPLSPALSPLVPRREREKSLAFDRFMGKKPVCPGHSPSPRSSLAGRRRWHEHSDGSCKENHCAPSGTRGAGPKGAGKLKQLALAFLLLLPLLAVSQPYSLGRNRIIGGGGTSAGGSYQIRGTVGGQQLSVAPVVQPEVGAAKANSLLSQADTSDPATPSRYSLRGGTWSLLAAVPTPGAPLLTITRLGPNTAAVSWPSPSIGFILQENSSLTTTNWTKVDATPVLVSGQNQVLVSPPNGPHFYRLKFQ